MPAALEGRMQPPHCLAAGFVFASLVGCDHSVGIDWVGATQPALVTDAAGASSYSLTVRSCTEAKFEETVTTQGPEDDNRTLYGDDGARADDPNVLSVQPSGRFWQPVAPPSTGQTNWFADDTPAPTFLICGLAVGQTTLRIYRGGSLESTLTMRIVPAE
jgi:hypothetical protein